MGGGDAVLFAVISERKHKEESALPANFNLFYSLLSDFQQLFWSFQLLCPLSFCILRHLLHHQTRSKYLTLPTFFFISFFLFFFFLVVLCLPFTSLQLFWSPQIRKGSAGIISQPREWLVKCLLITLLCVHSLTLPELRSHRRKAPHTAPHSTANNAPRFRHSFLPSCPNTRALDSCWQTVENTRNVSQALANQNSSLRLSKLNNNAHSFQVTCVWKYI